MKKQIIMCILLGCLLCGCGKGEEQQLATETFETVESTVDEVESETTDIVNQAEIEKDENSQEKNDAILLYERFLGLQESDEEVNVYINPDNGFYEFSSEMVSFSELQEYVKNNYLYQFSEEHGEINVSYAYIDCGMDGKNELAIRFSGLGIYEPNDDSFAVFIIGEKNKQLFLAYQYECWARSYTSINEYGYISGGGSCGAGDHIFNAGIIDADGMYGTVYEAEELFGWYIHMINDDVYNSVYNSSEIEFEPNMIVVKYRIGDNEICTYSMMDEEENVQQANERFVDECAKQGIVWKSQEEIDELIQNRENELGITQEIKNGEEPEWNELLKY